MASKTRPRDPNAGNNLTTARISDNAKNELREIAEQAGMSLSEVTRKAIMAGLPKVKKDLAKKPG